MYKSPDIAVLERDYRDKKASVPGSEPKAKNACCFIMNRLFACRISVVNRSFVAGRVCRLNLYRILFFCAFDFEETFSTVVFPALQGQLDGFFPSASTLCSPGRLQLPLSYYASPRPVAPCPAPPRVARLAAVRRPASSHTWCPCFGLDRLFAATHYR